MNQPMQYNIELDINNKINKIIFKIGQGIPVLTKEVIIKNKIARFNFYHVQDEFIEIIQRDSNMKDIDILQLSDNKLQYVGIQPSIRKDEVGKLLFGAAICLQINYREEREIMIDAPKVLTASSESIVLGKYSLEIRKEDMEIENSQYYRVSQQNYLGKAQESIVLVINYSIKKLCLIKQDCNATESQNMHQQQQLQFIPLSPFGRVSSQLSKHQLMHLLQKILTIFSEGRSFYSLSQHTIFHNPILNCLEFIAIPQTLHPKQFGMCTKQILNQLKTSEIQICRQVLQCFDTCNMFDSKLWYDDKMIIVGDRLVNSNDTHIAREPYLICLNHQIGLPFYWHLFHGLTYKEDENLKYFKNKKFIIYYINSLAFYYDGNIDPRNYKHSIDQLCHIYCFSMQEKNEIDSMLAQYISLNIDKDKLQNASVERQSLISQLKKLHDKLQEYFETNFHKNNHLIFVGHLKNNLPHGSCQIRTFLDPIYKYHIDNCKLDEEGDDEEGEIQEIKMIEKNEDTFIIQKSKKISEENKQMFLIKIDGLFVDGILDGEGKMYKDDKPSQEMYFDHFVDINFITNNHNKVMNISHHKRSWKQREIKKDITSQLLKNQRYLFMHYDATIADQTYGQQLRQFRSQILQRKYEQSVDWQIKKVFINIGRNSCENITCCKLFLKTNNTKYGQILVYILYEHTYLHEISEELAQNIIFAFTENYQDINSQYILYIDLSLIQRVNSIHIVSRLNPSLSIVRGLEKKFKDLPIQNRDFIFKEMRHLDFSFDENLFEEYLKIEHISNKNDKTTNLSNSSSQSGNLKRPSLPNRIQSQQDVPIRHRKSLVLKGCNLLNISQQFYSVLPLFHIDISGAQVPPTFLDSLPTEQFQFLRSMNISYTNLLYSSVQKYFSQQKPAQLLDTFICRGFFIEKNLLQSRKALFKQIIESTLLSSVQVLDISENNKVDEELIRIIYGYLQQLKSLSVSKCSELDSASHQYLYMQQDGVDTRLEKLDYSENQISFSYIKSSQQYKSIKSLDITNCTIKDTSSLYYYLETQKELYKLKLNYSLFADKKFQFLEHVFNIAKQLRKIYVLVKPEDVFDLKNLQAFISRGNLIQCTELNIYFYQSDDKYLKSSSNLIRKQQNPLNVLLKYINQENQYDYINIHLGKYQLINKKQLKDIKITFNYLKLKGLKLGLIYTPTIAEDGNQNVIFNENMPLELQDDVNTLNLSSIQIDDLDSLRDKYIKKLSGSQKITIFEKLNDIFNSSSQGKEFIAKNIESLFDGNKIDKLRLNTSIKYTQNLKITHLKELQAKKLQFECTEENPFPSFEKIERVVLSNLQIYFHTLFNSNLKCFQRFLKSSTVKDELQISLKFTKYSNTSQEQLQQLFQIFGDKQFTQCTKVLLRFEGINNFEIKQLNISTMIYNFSSCTDFSFAYLNSDIFDLQQFFQKLPNKYIKIELHLALYDDYVIEFIKRQRSLQHLILRIEHLVFNKNSFDFLKLQPIKIVEIHPLQRDDKEKKKIKELLLKIALSPDCKVTQIFFLDQNLKN